MRKLVCAGDGRCRFCRISRSHTHRAILKKARGVAVLAGIRSEDGRVRLQTLGESARLWRRACDGRVGLPFAMPLALELAFAFLASQIEEATGIAVFAGIRDLAEEYSSRGGMVSGRAGC